MSASQDPSEHGVRAVLRRRRPLLFILIVLCLLFVASYTTRLGTLRRLQVEQAELLQRQQDAQVDTLRLKSDLEEVTSDAHVEKVAIEDLGMARDEETVVTLVDAPEVALPATDATTDTAVVDERATASLSPPIWRQWVELFLERRE